MRHGGTIRGLLFLAVLLSAMDANAFGIYDGYAKTFAYTQYCNGSDDRGTGMVYITLTDLGPNPSSCATGFSARTMQVFASFTSQKTNLLNYTISAAERNCSNAFMGTNNLIYVYAPNNTGSQAWGNFSIMWESTGLPNFNLSCSNPYTCNLIKTAAACMANTYNTTYNISLNEPRFGFLHSTNTTGQRWIRSVDYSENVTKRGPTATASGNFYPNLEVFNFGSDTTSTTTTTTTSTTSTTLPGEPGGNTTVILNVTTTAQNLDITHEIIVFYTCDSELNYVIQFESPQTQVSGCIRLAEYPDNSSGLFSFDWYDIGQSIEIIAYVGDIRDSFIIKNLNPPMTIPLEMVLQGNTANYKVSFYDQATQAALIVNYSISRNGVLLVSGTGSSVTFNNSNPNLWVRLIASSAGYFDLGQDLGISPYIQQIFAGYPVRYGLKPYSSTNASGSLSCVGRIMPGESGMDLTEVPVEVTCGGHPLTRAYANSTGYYVINLLPVETECTFTAGGSGFTSASSSKKFYQFSGVQYCPIFVIREQSESGNETIPNTRYTQFFEVNGQTIDQLGYVPLGNAQISVECSDGTSYVENTGAAGNDIGRASIELYNGVRCSYTVSAENYRIIQGTVKQNPQIINLPSTAFLGCSVYGVCRGSDGKPAVCLVQLLNRQKVDYQFTTRDDGLYSFAVDCGTTYQLKYTVANCTGYQAKAGRQGETGDFEINGQVEDCTVPDHKADIFWLVGLFWAMIIPIGAIMIFYILWLLFDSADKVKKSFKSMMGWDDTI